MESVFLILSSAFARFILLPLMVVAVGAFYKYFCQNDKHSDFSRKLFYWGPDLCISGLLALIVDFSCNLGNLPQQEINSYHSKILFLVILCGIIMFILSLIIRKFGFKKTDMGYDYHLIWGIILPDAIGLFLLFLIYKIIES